MTKRYRTWRCDNGTFDLIDIETDEIVETNVHPNALADAYMALTKVRNSPPQEVQYLAINASGPQLFTNSRESMLAFLNDRRDELDKLVVYEVARVLTPKLVPAHIELT